MTPPTTMLDDDHPTRDDPPDEEGPVVSIESTDGGVPGLPARRAVIVRALLSALEEAGLTAMLAGQRDPTLGVEIVLHRPDLGRLLSVLRNIATRLELHAVPVAAFVPPALGLALAWSQPPSGLGLLRLRLTDPLGLAGDDAERLHRGLHVVVLGPDGAGKSAVLDALQSGWAPLFSRIERRHLLPTPARRASEPGFAVDPHGRPPRGRLGSLAKLAQLALAYRLGHHRHVAPHLSAGALVLFDRYAHDLVVDPLRFRYGGPPGLARRLLALAPVPDLVFGLDAPVEVLHARKAELAPDELGRQRAAYRALVDATPGGVLLDAARPLESVVAQAHAALLTRLAARLDSLPGGDGTPSSGNAG